MGATADAHVGLAILREAALLLRKHSRLHTLLDVEGGLFGLGGVTDRAVSVIWHLQPLAFSIVPYVSRVGNTLPVTLPQLRALVTDVFPQKNAHMWLVSEFLRHVGPLAKIPAPHVAAKASHHGVVAFASEA